ncbi:MULTISPECIES: hypothetical protein [Morganellaceae]|uniref:Cystatin domain-containing protein n=2 Tax=Morganellaceae TaxID=1903414 RepID=A0A1B8HMJ4_9GAMM|nr:MULTISPECIES: hypothetical protein [Morganellaceae]OBU10534.1 hypothetical protein AYY17_15430 [Morganella psychrotolerans]UNH40605.1 hypothetical protein MNY70_17360 [Moellerella wisconsensis]UNH44309.1 hypothetical protein MNY66_16310 [Moellerella wisconsensis]
MKKLILVLSLFLALPVLAQTETPSPEGDFPKLHLNEENEQIARKVAFDYLANAKIFISQGVVSKDTVTYEAIIADQRCTIEMELNNLPIERWLVKKLDCKN